MKSVSVALRPTSVVLALLLSLSAAPLHAELIDGSVRYQAEFLRVQSNGISRDQAAEIVKRRYGGKILAISEVQKGGRSLYRIKGLSDKSQVYVVYVDKQSGRISR
ncbi:MULTISPECIES: PepSY domain-containing protein [unclassified Microbulbifer]|uniref:PepSY domain-containing protein n=1 Tax=unclassified Microbulbifer TaxID=2619833 RepID=UPI0027E55573|nr:MULTISPECIES: PepSY domain-containing protein [unclassified Microbulbifer]